MDSGYGSGGSSAFVPQNGAKQIIPAPPYPQQNRVPPRPQPQPSRKSGARHGTGIQAKRSPRNLRKSLLNLKFTNLVPKLPNLVLKLPNLVLKLPNISSSRPHWMDRPQSVQSNTAQSGVIAGGMVGFVACTGPFARCPTLTSPNLPSPSRSSRPGLGRSRRKPWSIPGRLPVRAWNWPWKAGKIPRSETRIRPGKPGGHKMSNVSLVSLEA